MSRSVDLGAIPPQHYASRLAALLGFASAMVHLAAVHQLAYPFAGLMLVLASGCAICSIGLWRRPTLHGWMLTGVLNSAMIVAHASMMASRANGHEPLSLSAHLQRHLHGEGFDLMHVATAMAAAEVLLVLFGATQLLLRSRPPASPDPAYQAPVLTEVS